MNDLIPLDAALQAIAQAQSPVELVELSDQAEAFRVYARRAGLSLAVQNRAAEIRLRCERRIGEMLLAIDRLRGRPAQKRSGAVRLSELGVTRKLSSRAQKLAQVPAAIFNNFIRDTTSEGNEVTTRALLTLSNQRAAQARNRQPMRGGHVDDLFDLVHDGVRFGTIYADPPWPVGGSTLPYPAMTVEQIAQLLVTELAAPRCHLHIWAGDGFLLSALSLIEHWGFRLVSSFVWVTYPPSRGNYWRSAHMLLLTAVNSPADRFDDRSLKILVGSSPVRSFGQTSRGSPNAPTIITGASARIVRHVNAIRLVRMGLGGAANDCHLTRG